MNIRVFFHVWLLMKSFATILTRIGPRVRVNEQMSWERARSLEALATLGALEASLLLMRCRSMMLQADRMSELLVTLIALVLKATLAIVCVRASRVHLEAVRRAELLLALVTLITARYCCCWYSLVIMMMMMVVLLIL